jgi:prevent-host-death family protein
MRIASIAEIKSRFSGFLKASEDGPVIVTKNGKPVALLLAMTDEEEIERMILAYSPKFQKILRAAEVQIREGKGISHEDFWEETMTKPDDPASKTI